MTFFFQTTKPLQPIITHSWLPIAADIMKAVCWLCLALDRVTKGVLYLENERSALIPQTNTLNTCPLAEVEILASQAS